jgi:RHS repeat-associated protein
MLIGANPSRGQKIKACVSCNSEGECERHTETEKDYGPQINKKYPEEGLAPVRTNSNNDEDEEEEEDPSQTDESDGSGEETEAKKEQSKNVESGGVEEKRPDGGKPTQPEESEQTTQGGDRHSVNTPPAEEAQSEESEAPNDNSSSNRTVRNESGPDEDPTGFSNDYLATPPTGSATQSDESTGSSDNVTNTGDDGSGQPSDVDGDPVRLATGAFTLSHTDLSYPGPAMSLRFQRRYTSRSDDRSVLGSNWTHNFDVRLTAVTPENAPSWAPEYCTGWSPQTTCAYVKYANGEKRLFYRDPGSDRFHIRGTVFVPQAGTTETLVRWPEDDGWVLRRPNGFKRYFNPQGRLTHLRDRFGNSITLRYEATPLYTAYVRYCRTDYFEKLYRTDNGSNLDPRFCRSLGVALGDRSMPEIREDTGWSTASSAAAGASPIKIPFDTPSHAQPFPTEQDTWFSDSPNSSEDYRRRLRRTRLYLVRLFNMGAMPSASTGQRKLRPVSATDDLGRTLEFDYHRDPTEEQFGLLKSVQGPGGAKVDYSYDTPPSSFPDRLNEAFLSKVERTDNPSSRRDGIVPGPDRTFEFDYQWPGVAKAWEQWTESQLTDGAGNCENADNMSLKDQYACYFQQFVACRYGRQAPCGVQHYQENPGNPCFLAALQEQSVISDIADNIVRVRRDGEIESETKFQHSPDRPDFDKVQAQRFGGHSTQGERSNSSGSGHWNWKSSLPKVTFDYTQAGVKDSRVQSARNPVTSSLPDEILQKYPDDGPPTRGEEEELEYAKCEGVMQTAFPDGMPPDGDAVGEVETPTCTWEDDDPAYQLRDHENGRNAPECDLEAMCNIRRELPQFRPRVSYYDPPERDASREHPPLRRTRLSCEQLAAHQMSNPAHNEVLTHRTGEQGTTTKHEKLEFLTHSKNEQGEDETRFRIEIERNLRRICKWVETTDRDGDETYYGLNYKGQTLVEATKQETEESSSDQYVYRERLYNADGEVIEKRRPVEGSKWEPRDGGTYYTYYDYDTHEEADDVRATTPFYWSKRANLKKVRTTPRSDDATDFEWSESSSSLDSDQSEARLRKYKYEPLYNQVRRVTFGTETADGSPDWSRKLYYDFDYQELDFNHSSKALQSALLYMRHWGAYWLFDTISDRFGELRARQIGVWFYGRDLNGDGFQGFEHHTTDADGDELALNRVKGVPVRIVHEDLETNETRKWHLDYAPNGRLNMLDGPGKQASIFEYYTADQNSAGRDAMYGDPAEGRQNETSAGYKGLLGRVVTRRFGLEENLQPSPGPSCADLAGPYRYLVGECPNGARSALTKAGVPSRVADAIVAASQEDSAHKWSETVYTYNRTGHRRSIWRDGLETRFRRDVDGRLRHLEDPKGNQVEIERTKEGWPRAISYRGPNGDLLRHVSRQFDNAGRVVARCQAASVKSWGGKSACNLLLNGGRVALDTSRMQRNPVYLLTTYRYTGEGQVEAKVDPSGTKTTFTYDSQKRPVERRIHHPDGRAKDRVVTYEEYDEEGRVERIEFGSNRTRSQQGALNQRFTYDGFGRLRTMVDRRGTHWQFAYDDENNLVARKQSTSPYQPGTGTRADWELWHAYDGFGRRTRTLRHHRTAVDYSYTASGHLYRRRVDGEGTTFRFLDYSGRPLVTHTPADTRVAQTFNPRASNRSSTRTTIRVSNYTDNGSKERRTTGQYTTRDEYGDPVERFLYGHRGEQRYTSFERDGLGRVTRRTVRPNKQTADLFERTKIERNLLGWPRKRIRWRDENGQNRDTVRFKYDPRGNEIRTVDSSGEATRYKYNPFGEKTATFMPQDSNRPHEKFTYDGYGRIERRSLKTDAGYDHIDTKYDQRGDPVEKTWANWKHGPTTLVERTFDDLGRVTKTTDHNLRRGYGNQSSSSRRKVTHEFDYDPFGRRTEETLTVGSGQEASTYVVGSSYELHDGGRAWRRKLTYPNGMTLNRERDATGRLSSIAELSPRAPTQISFRWIGNFYTGRDQHWSFQSNRDPLRQRIEVDGLGRPIDWSYTAVDTTRGQPDDQSWGATYCGGDWSTVHCADPLLDLEVKRDGMGRVRSVSREFGHPMFEENGNRVAAHRHQEPWRGYHYNARSQLIGAWEHTGRPDSVDASSLKNHEVSGADVRQVAREFNNKTGVEPPAELWNYVRGRDFPDLKAVEEQNTNRQRWSTSTPRSEGHQLEEVTFEGTSHTVEHDAYGRVTARTPGPSAPYRAEGHQYVFDQRGRLAAVLRPDGDIVAEYYYDAAGRLVSVEEIESPTTDLIWDGDHIIAERPHNPQFGLGYNYVWGARQDQLVEIQDRGASHEGFPAKTIPLTDHRNSVVGLWSASEAELTDIIDYTSHGRITVKDSREETDCEEQGTGGTCYVPDTPFLFGSLYRSRRTGLSYMRNRWYSARLKQFLSPDPAGYVDSYNPYAYVAFDPINGWDPYGLGEWGFAPDITDWADGPLGRDLRLDKPDLQPSDNTSLELLEGAGKTLGNTPWDLANLGLMGFCAVSGCDAGELQLERPFSMENWEEEVGGNMLTAIELGIGGLGAAKSVGKGAARNLDDMGKKYGPRARNICSFTAGTQVRMCDGSMRPIEEVETGDRVLSRDAETGEVDCREVRNPYVEYKPVAEVTLESGDGTTEVIESTTSHPFRVRGEGWVKVGEMTPGSQVVGASGEELLVTRVAFTTRSESVYNFGVEEFRSYFVGESGAWVHNCWIKKLRKKSPDKLKAEGWEDVTHPKMRENTDMVELKNPETGQRIRFDPGTPGETGYSGKDHYHVYNPESTGKGDYYLDEEGNPVPKNSSDSHILLED